VTTSSRTALAAIAAITLLGATAMPGCGSSCSGGALPGLRVTVADGPGGPAVCGATVTAQDGSYNETLIQGTAASGACVYVGAYERPGTYTIEAVDGTRMVTVQNVRVSNGACNVTSTQVTATLPAP
jgi:hypothetical protein